jgi:hypothetical protein
MWRMIFPAMRKKNKKTSLEALMLAIPCPTCGAMKGEKCEINSGQPRTDAHRDRLPTTKKPLAISK